MNTSIEFLEEVLFDIENKLDLGYKEKFTENQKYVLKDIQALKGRDYFRAIHKYEKILEKI